MLHNVLKSYLEHICGKKNVEENVMMSARTTFKIGGAARFFVSVTSKKVLIKLISALQYIEHPYRVIGGGSNLLVSDSGFDGVVIRLKMRETVENGSFIYADAGVSLAAAAKFARERSLGGLEFTAGIPGTVGGAVYMNAGAHGSKISDVIVMTDVLHGGEVQTLDARACKFSYRTSIFQKRNDIILGAYFFLKPCQREQIEKTETEYLNKRHAIPKEPSAGSIFRNPEGHSAARLIDSLGLKGTAIGNVQVSAKHANFIINLGGGRAEDVKKLIRLIKKKVRTAYGINLRTEIVEI